MIQTVLAINGGDCTIDLLHSPDKVLRCRGFLLLHHASNCISATDQVLGIQPRSRGITGILVLYTSVL